MTLVCKVRLRGFPLLTNICPVDDDVEGLDVSDREEGSSSQIKSGPARSYIDMRDRTTWGHDDTSERPTKCLGTHSSLLTLLL